MIFSPVEIQETVNMFMRQKLDIRCITMGISLLDCACEDEKKACSKIYDKIMRYAGKLVQTGQDIEKEYGERVKLIRGDAMKVDFPELEKPLTASSLLFFQLERV